MAVLLLSASLQPLNVISRRRLVVLSNRRNLLLRDDHACQYCGYVGPASELTIDHVVPVSRGGAPNTWENQVVACKKCNWRKANRVPSEVGLHLRRAPKPLTHEYAHILFLRYPDLKAAYEAFVA